jgi:hypothetical protein
MIRRLFWLIVGALLGVTGYRRVGRLARAVGGSGRPGTATRSGRGRDHAAHGWARSAALFARDVRDGMDLYADRHPRLAGRTLEGQQARAQRLHPAGAAGEELPGRGRLSLDDAKDGR